MAWNNDINFRHYQDFDDMYHNLLDEIINGGVQYQDSTDGTVENLHITCDSFNCTLQPRDVLFKPITRWKYLCSRYLDFDEWRLFKKGLESKKIPQSRTCRFKEGNVEILGDDIEATYDEGTLKEGKKKLLAPTVIFTKDDNYIGSHVSTVPTHTNASDNLTEPEEKELKGIYQGFIDQINPNICVDDEAC